MLVCLCFTSARTRAYMCVCMRIFRTLAFLSMNMHKLKQCVIIIVLTQLTNRATLSKLQSVSSKQAVPNFIVM